MAGSAAAIAALLCACSGNTSPGPVGWTRVDGKTALWTLGSGATEQSYQVEHAPFTGSLAELGGRATIAIVLGTHGARMRSTIAFPPCPGAAGIATFTTRSGIIEEAYGIRDGVGTTARYERPSNVAESPAVTAAMQRTLCTSPA